MVLREHLEHQETAGRRVEVNVFASDASPGALETAPRGRYPAGACEQVSTGRLGPDVDLRETLGRRVMLVALTGYQDDPVRLREAGFDAHLLKPACLEKLFALVAELDRKREEASPPPEDSA